MSVLYITRLDARFACVFSSPAAHRALHSFPTRRSSDLAAGGAVLFAAAAGAERHGADRLGHVPDQRAARAAGGAGGHRCADRARSEEHTSELQSRENLVCRLLLEKKKKNVRQVVYRGQR